MTLGSASRQQVPISAYVRRPTGEMIPYTEKVISDTELADIFAWLRAIPPPPPVNSIPLFKSK